MRQSSTTPCAPGQKATSPCQTSLAPLAGHVLRQGCARACAYPLALHRCASSRLSGCPASSRAAQRRRKHPAFARHPRAAKYRAYLPGRVADPSPNRGRAPGPCSAPGTQQSSIRTAPARAHRAAPTSRRLLFTSECADTITRVCIITYSGLAPGTERRQARIRDVLWGLFWSIGGVIWGIGGVFWCGILSTAFLTFAIWFVLAFFGRSLVSIGC